MNANFGPMSSDLFLSYLREFCKAGGAGGATLGQVRLGVVRVTVGMKEDLSKRKDVKNERGGDQALNHGGHHGVTVAAEHL